MHPVSIVENGRGRLPSFDETGTSLILDGLSGSAGKVEKTRGHLLVAMGIAPGDGHVSVLVLPRRVVSDLVFSKGLPTVR